MTTTLLLKLLACLTTLSVLEGSLAQTYPTQPIKLVMPFVPGTAAENALRMLAEKLGSALKQSVVIENRPGAGSTLGTEFVAKGAADGYTLLATFNSSIAPGTLMYSKIGYDPVKDFHKNIWPSSKTNQEQSITPLPALERQGIWPPNCSNKP